MTEETEFRSAQVRQLQTLETLEQILTWDDERPWSVSLITGHNHGQSDY